MPGDEQEKIAPLLRPIRDNLEQLVDGNEDLRYENEQELAERIDEIFDRPFLDERTNVLMYAAEKMKESPLCWQVTMLPGECERSELALDAILRLS